MLASPLFYLAGAATDRLLPRNGRSTRWATAAAFLSSLAAALLAFISPYMLSLAPVPISLLSPSPVSLALLVLINFIGLLISEYSRQYLRGEPNAAGYRCWLQLTLASVCVVILSNHMLVLVLGWVVISTSLHQLLMFYPHRPRAALAAHKKFLFARLAELSLLVAVLLLYNQHGSWYISEIMAAYPVSSLTLQEQLAALLLAQTALIKCAQLPVHGWLMQVVEAPTPVSALLHAGIINLGGYLMILFAPLLVQATAAQWFLLVVAGVTTLLASLVMMTRVSIKVRLAWSTCAQMGLMLVECALGLFELALLHLLAHSCYKAYSFLDAGSAVEQDLVRRMAPPSAPGIFSWLATAALSSALILTAVQLSGLGGPLSPWLLLALALTLLLAERRSRIESGGLLHVCGVAVVLVTCYSLQKAGMGFLAQPAEASAGWPADAWISALIILLFAGYWLLRYRAGTALGRKLWIQMFAGFYLDEWVTRTTLKLWPIELPDRTRAKRLPLTTKEVKS
jgi:NAD(P)H-quinone oxidoreductase subunit 5